MTAAIVSGKRKRGGQPGNTNAWKHGRRSRAARTEQAAFRRHLRQMWAHIRLARAVMGKQQTSDFRLPLAGRPKCAKHISGGGEYRNIPPPVSDACAS
jgi:hypothetical protein